MDKYVLYEMKKSEKGYLEPQEKYNNDKKFLTDKLCIPFERIQENISEQISVVKNCDIVDLIYEEVYYACHGYSLETFIELGYKEYKHEHWSVSRHIRKRCEQQIKARSILSALYTVMYYYKKDEQVHLLKSAKKYSMKEYYSLDKKGRKIESEFQGYVASEVQVANRLRRSFDKIYNRLSDETQLKSSYFKNVIEVTKEEDKRQYGSFLEEFSHDLIVNNLGGGFDFDNQLQNLYRNVLKREVFRRNTKKFAKGLCMVETNFHPYREKKIKNETELLESILYYFKKESMFRTTLFNIAIKSSDEYIMRHLKDIVDVPVIPDMTPFLELFQNAYNEECDLAFIISYISDVTFPIYEIVFFMSLCECLDYDIEKIYRVLLDCLKKEKIEFVLPPQPISFNMVEREKADAIGGTILKYYQVCNIYPTIEHSFSSFVETVDFGQPEFHYKQMLMGMEYYKNLKFDFANDFMRIILNH